MVSAWENIPEEETMTSVEAYEPQETVEEEIEMIFEQNCVSLHKATEFKEVRIEQIKLDPKQPRKNFGDLTSIMESIEKNGILQPLIVMPIDGASYRLVAGERRYRAACELGWKSVPVSIRNLSEEEILKIQLIENLHREDISPFETAEAFYRLHEEFGWTQEQIATEMAVSQEAVSQLLKIRNLPETIREEYLTSNNPHSLPGKSILIELSRAKTVEEQEALWAKVKTGKTSVKAVRANLRETSTKKTKQRVSGFRKEFQDPLIQVLITSNQLFLTRSEMISTLEGIIKFYKSYNFDEDEDLICGD